MSTEKTPLFNAAEQVSIISSEVFHNLFKELSPKFLEKLKKLYSKSKVSKKKYSSAEDLYELHGFHRVKPLDETELADENFVDVCKYYSEGVNPKQFQFILSAQLGFVSEIKSTLEEYNQKSISKIWIKNPVDFVDRDGNTALHWAALNGQSEILRYLIHHGADVNRLNKNHMSPINFAVKQGQLDCFLLLAKAGAKFNLDPIGRSILSQAVISGNLELVNKLIKNSKFDLDDEDYNGITPLFLAVKFKHANIAALLLKRGANYKSITNTGRNLLHYAAEYYDPVIWKMITNLDGIDYLLADQENVQPVHLAAIAAPRDCISDLLRRGASTRSRTYQADTIFMIACEHDNLDVMRFLLNFKADYYSRLGLARFKKIMLDYIESGNKLGIRIFLWFIKSTLKNKRYKCKKKQKSFEKELRQLEYMALLKAADCGNLYCLKKIINSGVGVNSRLKVTKENPKYSTALICAARSGNLDCVLELLEYYDIKVDKPDGFGNTALHYAAKNGHVDCVRNLISSGANIHELNQDSCKPVDLAVRKGQTEVMRELILNDYEFLRQKIFWPIKAINHFFKNIFHHVKTATFILFGAFFACSSAILGSASFAALASVAQPYVPLIVLAVIPSSLIVACVIATLPILTYVSAYLLATSAVLLSQSIRYSPLAIKMLANKLNDGVFELGKRLLGYKTKQPILKDFTKIQSMQPRGLRSKLSHNLGILLIKISCYFSKEKSAKLQGSKKNKTKISDQALKQILLDCDMHKTKLDHEDPRETQTRSRANLIGAHRFSIFTTSGRAPQLVRTKATDAEDLGKYFYLKN